MNNLDKQYTDLIGNAYKKYCLESRDIDLPENLYNKLIDDLNEKAMFPIDNPNRRLSQEEFINKIKTDDEFAKRWGVKVEVRELSAKERIELAGGKIQEKYPALIEQALNVCDEREIPTKAISFTYNNQTIEIYENNS